MEYSTQASWPCYWKESMEAEKWDWVVNQKNAQGSTLPQTLLLEVFNIWKDFCFHVTPSTTPHWHWFYLWDHMGIISSFHFHLRPAMKEWLNVQVPQSAKGLDKSPDMSTVGTIGYHSAGSILLWDGSSWQKSSSFHCIDGETGPRALAKHRDDKVTVKSLGLWVSSPCP